MSFHGEIFREKRERVVLRERGEGLGAAKGRRGLRCVKSGSVDVGFSSQQ